MRLFLILIGSFASCKKEDTSLPGPSSSGENYLACTISGKPYVFKGRPVGLNPNGVSYTNIIFVNLGGALTRELEIAGLGIGNQNAQIYLRLSSDTSYIFSLNKKIAFSEIGTSKTYVLLESPVDFSDKYYYADPSTGWIQFSRLDSVGAGTFGFTAFVMDGAGNKTSDSMVVSDGRFDIQD